MKKVLSFAFVFVMTFTLAACGGNNNSPSDNSRQGQQPAESIGSESSVSQKESNNESTSAYNKEGVDAVKDVRVKLTFNNEEVIVKMYDNPTSRDFLKLLPLTLTFKDFAGSEKIGFLPKRLSTEAAPSGSDPSVGNFTYYTPWGNLAIFYKNFSPSSVLIPLGNIESGIDKLASIDDDFTVTIERMSYKKGE